MIAQMDAAMWAVYADHGVEPGSRQARFWGTPQKAWPRFRRKMMDWALARRRLSAFSISPENSRSFFHTLRRFRPDHAYGYPTLMNHFVAHCEGWGLDGTELQLKVVMSTGEILSPEVQSRLETFFGCPVINEYGCTESGILAIGCRHGRLHAVPWATYMEVVDPGSGRRVRDGAGEVLLTDLFGDVNPLLRYQLGDRVVVSDAACPCGSARPEVSVEVGRVDGLIRLPGGKVMYDAILAYTVPTSVQRFLVEQRSESSLHAYVVPGPGFSSGTASDLGRTWAAALGGNIRVDVEVVEQIPYDQSGKLRYFRPMEDEGRVVS